MPKFISVANQRFQYYGLMEFNHFGLVVKSIEQSAKFYEQSLGMRRMTEVIYDPIQKVNFLFLSVKDFPHFVYELIEPRGENSPSSQWSKKRSYSPTLNVIISK